MNVSYRHPGPFAVVGLIAAFAFAVILAVAANADSAWVYGESMISDLGVSDVQLSADLFNYGCVVIGILLFVFGVGKAACETGCNRASGCLLAIAAIFLVLIGYIHSDFGNGNTHDTIAILLFAFLFVSMVVSAIGDWTEGYRLNGALTAILIVVCLGCAVGMPIAQLEVIAAACAVVWVLGISVKMIFASRKA